MLCFCVGVGVGAGDSVVLDDDAAELVLEVDDDFVVDGWTGVFDCVELVVEVDAEFVEVEVEFCVLFEAEDVLSVVAGAEVDPLAAIAFANFGGL